MRGSKGEPELDELEAIVRTFNERFGNIDWIKDDKIRKVMFEEIPDQLAGDEDTMRQIMNSDRQNAKITSDEKTTDVVMDFMTTSTDFYKMFMDNPDFKRQYLEFIFDRLWKQAGEQRVAGR